APPDRYHRPVILSGDMRARARIRSLLAHLAAPAGAAVLAALALWAASTVATTGPRRDPVSPVIFPEQRIPLTFSHARHLALDGYDPLTCETCHDAEGSRSSLDSLIPGEDACTICHDI